MRTLVISDFHAPFGHPGAVDFLSKLRREVKPDEVVCIGDEHDAHGWSRHQRSPDAPGQREELELARKQLAPLYKLFPKVKVCRSNHGERSFKAAARAGLPAEFIRSSKDVLAAPSGWDWAFEWLVDGVVYAHGEGVSGKDGAMKLAERNRCSTVIGHLHSNGGIAYSAGAHDMIWAMAVGCLIDVSSIAFEYAKHGKRPVLGTGYVIDGVPYFEPLR